MQTLELLLSCLCGHASGHLRTKHQGLHRGGVLRLRDLHEHYVTVENLPILVLLHHRHHVLLGGILIPLCLGMVQELTFLRPPVDPTTPHPWLKVLDVERVDWHHLLCNDVVIGEDVSVRPKLIELLLNFRFLYFFVVWQVTPPPSSWLSEPGISPGSHPEF